MLHTVELKVCRSLQNVTCIQKLIKSTLIRKKITSKT